MLNLLTRSTDPEDRLKGSQLQRGKTKARVEALEADLKAARQTVADLTAQEGVMVADSGLPSTPNKALIKAQDSLRQLEAGLAVALERDQKALDDLAKAQLLANIAEEEKTLARLKYEVCPKGDKLLEAIEAYVKDDLAPAMEAARIAGGDGVHTNFLVNITQGFEMFLLRAARQIVFKGRANVVLLKGKTLTTLIPDPSSVAERRGVTR